jgi:hypothetical protein
LRRVSDCTIIRANYKWFQYVFAKYFLDRAQRAESTHKKPPEQDLHTPPLKRFELKRVEERVDRGAHVVHETINHEGEEEFKRSSSALAPQWNFYYCDKFFRCALAGIDVMPGMQSSRSH